ncbi:MAG: DUF615 domain-containing protein [Deltaproteobacteria bacterium]|nr:DUF615 domain-containing protein [Deltaproteobacteria bacterium]
MARKPKFQPEEAAERVTRGDKRAKGDHSEELGKRLIAMPVMELDRIPLDQLVRRYVDDARAIPSYIAHKRALRRLAALLREEGLEKIEALFGDFEQDARKTARAFKALERLRSRILEEGIDVLEKKLNVPITPEWQKIVDDAQHEEEWTKPKGAKKKLFKALSDAFVAGELTK